MLTGKTRHRIEFVRFTRKPILVLQVEESESNEVYGGEVKSWRDAEVEDLKGVYSSESLELKKEKDCVVEALTEQLEASNKEIGSLMKLVSTQDWLQSLDLSHVERNEGL